MLFFVHNMQTVPVGTKVECMPEAIWNELV